ncbi:MAG TPA: hypothetical protein VFE62_15495, partial [Gemmataceae bacterium]|nr:hypothetical protein [Gemmataceae bacterium]
NTVAVPIPGDVAHRTNGRLEQRIWVIPLPSPNGPFCNTRLFLQAKQCCIKERVMPTVNSAFHDQHEERVAQLTQAAYHAVLERGFRGSFLDLELALWSALRNAVKAEHESKAATQAA